MGEGGKSLRRGKGSELFFPTPLRPSVAVLYNAGRPGLEQASNPEPGYSISIHLCVEGNLWRVRK